MNAHGKTAGAYLAQRVMGTSPEQQAALIMEAGQLHLGRAIQALNRKDPASATASFVRYTEVISEANLRLNHEDGGELAENLWKLYGWWTKEVMLASRAEDTARLAAVAHSMGEIRQAWEQLHEKRTGAGQRPTVEFRDQVG